MFFDKTHKLKTMKNSTLYDIKVNAISGKEVALSSFKGKNILFVNVASKCGFTPQNKGLQELYSKYSSQGFEVLGFPCNQFGEQEPGSSDEIKEFCELNYSVSFPIFEKIDVNGENAHELYKFLKSEKSGLITDDIKWNFTKFLVDKNGKPIERYGSITTPESIEKDILNLLK